MHTISLPQEPKYTELSPSHGKIEILECYPGYGTTLGNAIRRVLLSSLEGAAVTSVKIKGVTHEFTTMPGVMEDMVQIILNLKQVRFRMESEEPMTISLKSKGEGKVTAGDFKVSTGLEIVNPDQVIATLSDKKAEIDMEVEVARGIGYIPVEQQEREKEIGTIAIDAIYTPVKRVNFEVENMRVGKRTDYDKITIEIMTDGSIAPDGAFNKAVDILMSQFSALASKEVAAPEKIEKVTKKKAAKKSE
ncbi:MAG: DNA-directed polymerase subunit alpha [Patescibacteria group bacterium]|jgi:DNA-directed RNA polymerase subunit alpha|nr:DNA-directed polymerase subunit alpha [Patescibacteria group bacterium]